MRIKSKDWKPNNSKVFGSKLDIKPKRDGQSRLWSHMFEGDL